MGFEESFGAFARFLSYRYWPCVFLSVPDGLKPASDQYALATLKLDQRSYGRTGIETVKGFVLRLTNR
jgi:hypothetical protein